MVGASVVAIAIGIAVVAQGVWSRLAAVVVGIDRSSSSSISSFVLRSVNETHIPIVNGTILSSEELDEWKYEGQIEVSKDGERKFVSGACAFHCLVADQHRWSLS